MQKRILVIFLISFLSLGSYALDIPKVKKKKQLLHLNFFKKKHKTQSHNKWVAAGLDVSLGLFGVHRLYLGTETHVPVMYTLTLGGGGVLILADLALILSSTDVEKYANNPSMFMWSIND